MRRREFLATLTIPALSGCVEAVSGGETSETTEISDEQGGSAGAQQTETPEISETSEESSGDSADMHPSSTVRDPFEVSLESWWGEKSLRYYDEERESLGELEPTGSWWLQPRVRVSNIGSQAAELPDISDFRALTPETHEPVAEFEQIDREQLRQTSDANIITVTFPDSYTTDGQLKPGDAVTYVPLYDVGELGELSLAWSPGEEMRFLATDVVHLGD